MRSCVVDVNALMYNKFVPLAAWAAHLATLLQDLFGLQWVRQAIQRMLHVKTTVLFRGSDHVKICTMYVYSTPHSISLRTFASLQLQVTTSYAGLKSSCCCCVTWY